MSSELLSHWFSNFLKLTVQTFTNTSHADWPAVQKVIKL